MNAMLTLNEYSSRLNRRVSIEGGLMQGVRAREVRFTPNSCYGERSVRITIGVELTTGLNVRDCVEPA